MIKGCISVIIPTKNRKVYLKQAIESVEKQRDVNIEIVVIDDGSTDETLDFLGTKRVKVLSGNGGPGKNRKKAFDSINGEFVIFLDDDDYYTNVSFFKKAIDIFNENSSVSAVMFNTETYYQYDNINNASHDFLYEGFQRGSDVLEGFMTKYQKPQSTFSTMFSVEKLRDGNIAAMKTLNDTQIYLRAFTCGDAYFVNEVAGRYRIHNRSIGNFLAVDFIIDNLDEKIRIADVLPTHINRSKWLQTQLLITLGYYAARSNVFDNRSIKKWLTKLDSQMAKSLWRSVKYERTKRWIKTLLNRKNVWQRET